METKTHDSLFLIIIHEWNNHNNSLCLDLDFKPKAFAPDKFLNCLVWQSSQGSAPVLTFTVRLKNHIGVHTKLLEHGHAL